MFWWGKVLKTEKYMYWPTGKLDFNFFFACPDIITMKAASLCKVLLLVPAESETNRLPSHQRGNSHKMRNDNMLHEVPATSPEQSNTKT